MFFDLLTHNLTKTPNYVIWAFLLSLGKVDGDHGAEKGDGDEREAEHLARPDLIVGAIEAFDGEPEPGKAKESCHGKVGVSGVAKHKEHKGGKSKGDDIEQHVNLSVMHALDDGKNRNGGCGIVSHPVYGNRIKVRHLPQDDNRKDDKRAGIHAAAHCAIPNNGGHGAGNAANQGAMTRAVFPDAIPENVNYEACKRDECGKQVCK